MRAKRIGYYSMAVVIVITTVLMMVCRESYSTVPCTKDEAIAYSKGVDLGGDIDFKYQPPLVKCGAKMFPYYLEILGTETNGMSVLNILQLVEDVEGDRSKFITIIKNRLLKSENSDIRRYAMRTLGRIGSAKDCPVMMYCYEDDPDRDVRLISIAAMVNHCDESVSVRVANIIKKRKDKGGTDKDKAIVNLEEKELWDLKMRILKDNKDKEKNKHKKREMLIKMITMYKEELKKEVYSNRGDKLEMELDKLILQAVEMDSILWR